MNCDANSLVNAARCFRFLPHPELSFSTIYALCRWANAQECDQDALDFLELIGISPDSTEGRAVCTLVSDLKNYPASGTKYWDRETIIYPMVGTTYDQQRVNLRNPGTFDMVQANVANQPIFSAQGMKGAPAVPRYMDTQFTPATDVVAPLAVDNIRVMWYEEAVPTTQFYSYFGTQETGGAKCFRALAPAFPVAMQFIYDINNANGNMQSGASAALAPGAKFIQRDDNAQNVESAFGSNAWVPRARAATALSTFPMLILATNNNSGILLPSDCTLSGFSLGLPLDVGHGAGVHTEHLEYKGIWDKFETALGRGHP